MYVGYYQDNNRSRLLVSERINGKRMLNEFPLILEYYVPDPNGYYIGIDDKKCKKITCPNYFTFLKHKKECKDQNIKTYELNFNLPNKVLYQQYKQGDAPKLNISFMDIEVDRKGFEYLTVKELVDKACCPINAISIYNSWQETLYTLMLCPENISFEEAQKICNKFDNTYLFKEESQLLNGIITILNDADVVSGWNLCVRKDTPIWLENKIIDINNSYENLKLYDSQIVKKSDITLKDEYKVETVLGNSIYSSNEHIFPVSIIDSNKYVSESLLNNTIVDKTVKEIMELQQNDKTCFVKICRRKNNNKALTYRDYILENLDWVLENYDLCFDAMNIKIDYLKSKIKQKCYSRIKNIISKQDIIEYIKSNEYITVYSNSYSGHFIIDLNEEINEDFLHILGLIYTDGSLNKDIIYFYNSNKAVIDKVTLIFDILKRHKTDKINPYNLSKGVYRRRITKNNKLGFLLSFIYNKRKDLNKTLLSMLSYTQFMAFFSGCIDGDGCLSKGQMTFCNYINDNIKLQELLLWNGIIATINSGMTNLLVKQSNNKIIKQTMKLWVDYKQKLLELFDNGNLNNSSSKAKETNIKEYNEDIFVRLKDIVSTGNKVEMIDICTDTHYFYANGIKTHNCFFDTPYIVRRIENVLGKGESKRLCLWDIEPTYKEKTNKFGDVNICYDIVGKWFVDYMELYIKHQRSQKESYKLDAIAEIELGERKVQHDESLDDMYRQRYEDFIKYNRQDTMLVKKFEDKLKYIEIHNAQAHDIRCSLESTMGTVGWVDQAIINEAHDKGLIVNDRDEGKNKEFEGIIPPGAYVPIPKLGLCKYIMSYDMNSLYPTSARSLNMSPESIVAQIRIDMTKEFLWNKIKENNLYKNKANKLPDWGVAWSNVWGTIEYQEVMKQSDALLTLDFETGESVQLSAKEIYDIIFKEGSNLCISGFGTIFRTDKMSLINSIFTRWYSQRNEYKREMARYEDMAVGVKIEDEELLKALEI